MANNLTKTHGDLKQVAVYDAGVTASGAGSSTGLNAVTSGVSVQPQGPKLQFGTFTSTVGHLTGDQVAAAVQAIQQLATVHMYEFTTGGTYDTLAFATYPVGAWDWADGQTADVAITAVAGAGTTAATATFTD